MAQIELCNGVAPSGPCDSYWLGTASTTNFFNTFFPLNFGKIYGSEKFLQNYTSSAVEDGGKNLPPWPMAVGVQSVFKKIIFFV
jgi:hypothetical protein